MVEKRKRPKNPIDYDYVGSPKILQKGKKKAKMCKKCTSDKVVPTIPQQGQLRYLS